VPRVHAHRSPPKIPPRGRRWRQALVVVVAIAAAFVPFRLLRPAPPVDGPIVFISIDTLRADHLPAYGYTRVATPAIDALAADGVVFERAYSHVPQTLPAHASILSGALPFEHGVRDNVGFTVPADLRLLPEWLHERGFATAAVVSADVLRRDTGIGRGFDFFDGEMPAVSGDVSSDRVRRDGSQSLEVAERWIDDGRSSRFFLFFHLYEPHAPYAPPPQFTKYQPYDGAIAYADEIVGRFLTFLRARRLYDAATIVLLSDHGEGLGDHGEQEHGLFVYEETMRVPLVVKLPVAHSHGRRIAQPVRHIDLVPTVLDLVGIPIPRTLQGRSLRPFLNGEALRGGDPPIYSESLYGRYHFGWSELTALTDSRYRFIHAPRDELYDLSADPAERRNVIDDRARTAAAMRAALAAIDRQHRVDAAARPTGEQVERLTALGYVTMQAGVPADTPGETLPDPKDKVEVLRTYRRVLELVQGQQLQTAIDLLRGLLAKEPSMADLWFELATLLRQAGRPADAIEAYHHVLQLNPRSTSGALALASALLKVRRFDDANAAARRALESGGSREPRDAAAAHELLARVALAREDAPSARREAAAAAAADPSLPLTQYVEGFIAYSAGDYTRALDAFERALNASRERTRQVAELHLYAGDTLAHAGRVEEAEREFREEIRFFPTNMWAYASLANLCRAEGRAADSNRAIDAMLRASPSPEAYALAAQLLTTFGDAERAAEVRGAARRLFTNGRSP